jgi:hypothetical protein
MCRRPSKYAPFLHIVETTPGLCGLLAQKVRDRSGYPSVVVVKTDKGYRGSGRSPEWYPFLTNANGHPGWEAAGHEGAFGISFDNESALEAFVAFIKADVEKKKPAPEMLPLNDQLVEFLKPLQDSGYVVGGEAPPTQMVYRRIERHIFQKVDTFGATPHVFRHSYISAMAEAGIDLKTIQHISGHSNVTTTMGIYAHTRLGLVQEAGDKVGELLRQ